MKHITKLSILAAIVAGFGTSVAFGDDPQLQSRLAVQRAQVQDMYAVKGLTLGRTGASQKETTIAFYSRGKSGIGRAGEKANRGEQRWNEVSTPHGTVNYFSPAK
jgi:hypothetical protein